MESNVYQVIKVIQGKEESRTHYLMRVASAMLRNNAYSINTIRYDDAECDALCLADDLESELEENKELIEQNRKLREGLKEMDEAFDSPGVVNDFWLRKRIKDLLKETEG